ncbi:putative haloacid dehalogenase-like hydrolase [Aspergillus leporis]|jgi:putative hydrolase of the HAD superfamily|uniref:Putative haloacid dehalogenase-like hydrolase n=1 Tax=Aspergillus leporis TaxID=41062 RepID=A0A5N5WSY9_9EURO|nr:putative haloacid dehalogenase-like hydrolase [Aspergillus leporis]
MPPNKRTLLLTLDAFGTLFHPRHPIPEQYASAAHIFGLPKAVITPERLGTAFKTAFKVQSNALPNYGRDDVLRGRYGGPRQWWEEVIRASFARAIASENPHRDVGDIELPEGLVGHLLDRFAGKEGYALFDDAGLFFDRVRGVKKGGLGPFERVLIGVISNSDDRVPGVLRSLGVRVGQWRADDGLRLPGFEEREGRGLASRGDGDVDDVDLVVTSYEAGEEKPSPRIFNVALRQAKALVGLGGGRDSLGQWTCVHVGDDYEKDYCAAIDAGWGGYFLPRGEDRRRLDGVNMIRSLTDLIPRLEAYE